MTCKGLMAAICKTRQCHRYDCIRGFNCQTLSWSATRQLWMECQIQQSPSQPCHRHISRPYFFPIQRRVIRPFRFKAGSMLRWRNVPPANPIQEHAHPAYSWTVESHVREVKLLSMHPAILHKTKALVRGIQIAAWFEISAPYNVICVHSSSYPQVDPLALHSI